MTDEELARTYGPLRLLKAVRLALEIHDGPSQVTVRRSDTVNLESLVELMTDPKWVAQVVDDPTARVVINRILRSQRPHAGSAPATATPPGPTSS